MEPTIFGDFLLLQRLSASAMAEVLLAVRLGDRSGRTFAVKRPLLGERASGRAAQAIAREAEVLEATRDAGLLRCEAAGSIAGLPYLATAYVRGASLRAVLDHGALSIDAARAVAKDLAGALAALHAAGWVHGDISPSNVIVGEDGESVLIDLGLASKIGAKRSEIAGTRGYVAPEAVRPTEPTPAEDVYGWAVVVAECALGARLFHDRELTDAATRADTVGAIDAIDADFVTDLRAALRRDPAARPTARAIAERLAGAILDRSALATAVAAAATAPEPPPPSPTVATRVELTPTAPMVVASSLTLPPPHPLVAERRRKRVNFGTSNPWRTIAIILLLGVAAAIGAITARASSRPRSSSVAFAGTIPRTAQLELDGRPSAPSADGTPLPISPGRHAVIVTVRPGDRREYTFTARAGEQVVIVPLLRLGGGSVERPEERP